VVNSFIVQAPVVFLAGKAAGMAEWSSWQLGLDLAGKI